MDELETMVRARPTAPAQTPPETKNWAATVLDQGCAQCGFVPAALSPAVVAQRIRSSVPRWQAVLARADAAVRPAPETWSPVEYACHVRDLCRLVPARVGMMLSFHDVTFADWDQDRAAVDGAYWSKDPSRIGRELAGWALAAAAVFDAVPDEQHYKTGRRGDGQHFTVTTLGTNLVHEIEHHLHDVAGGAGAARSHQ